MGDALAWRSALAHLPRTRIDDAGSSGRIRIQLLTGLGYIHLRLPADDGPTRPAVHAALGGELPRTPNTLNRLPAGMAYWLGPDEWLVQVSKVNTALLARALNEAMADRFAAVTDVTDAKATFVLAGTAAVDILRKGCAIDLHRTVFRQHSCAQTLLAKASILLACLAPEAQYAVIADRSDADYVWRWLDDAALEFTTNPQATPTIEEKRP
jgi:sarcosine oxidase, subunit gamma